MPKAQHAPTLRRIIQQQVNLDGVEIAWVDACQGVATARVDARLVHSMALSFMVLFTLETRAR